MLPFLRLMRPANIVTALADILAGFFIGLIMHQPWPGWQALAYPDLYGVLLATAGLYAGGEVLKDVFEAEVDALERPERPIPSGRVSLRAATLLGILLLLAGVWAVSQVGPESATIAVLVGGLAVLYDAYGKHHPWMGPLNMGLCRGGNLILGMSAWPLGPVSMALGLIPVLFISAVTLVSRGEVASQGKRPLQQGLILYLLLLAALTALQFWTPFENSWAWLFVILFAVVVLPPLLRALQRARPEQIGKAVKWGVLGLIPMDAALAASFAGWQAGLLILILLPLSLGLARLFAVT